MLCTAWKGTSHSHLQCSSLNTNKFKNYGKQRTYQKRYAQRTFHATYNLHAQRTFHATYNLHMCKFHNHIASDRLKVFLQAVLQRPNRRNVWRCWFRSIRSIQIAWKNTSEMFPAEWTQLRTAFRLPSVSIQLSSSLFPSRQVHRDCSHDFSC